MRFVQILFHKLEMIKTKKRWIWRIIFTFSIVPSSSLIWMYSDQHISNIIAILITDFIVYDFILMPIIGAIAYKWSQKVRGVYLYI